MTSTISTHPGGEGFEIRLDSFEAAPRPAAGSLTSNVWWMLSGNVVYSGCQWALLMALAKLGSAAQVGELALGLAITGPIFVASQLHLRAVQATDANDQFSFSDYLGLRWIATAIATLITVGLAFGLGYRLEIALVILLVGLARGFDNISDIYFGALQQHERMARMGKSLMLRGVLALAGLVAAMWLTRSVLSAAAVVAMVSGSTLLLYDRRSVALRGTKRAVLHLGPLRWNPSGYRALFVLSLPLTIVMVLVSLNLNIPRYFIQKYRGEADLGVFSALSYLIVVGNTLINACGQASAPRLAKAYFNGQRSRFWRMLLLLLGLAAACGLICVGAAAIAGDRIVTILYNASYAKYAALLTGLMATAGALYLSQFLGYGMTAARILRPQVPLLVLVTATTFTGCVVLIPRLGLAGAVIGMASGFAVQLVGSSAILFRRWLALRR
jgi:O-antigen/teichoic acid export membrane protein